MRSALFSTGYLNPTIGGTSATQHSNVDKNNGNGLLPLPCARKASLKSHQHFLRDDITSSLSMHEICIKDNKTLSNTPVVNSILPL
ncbi:hypothetical protein Naga_100831g1 [Nannochloropsis gaditana]|uniref:Uncharacterized protein n=1 Tax=Nannochloropsis gaditana TaxID=72520 RepID=W7SZN1_9STRA|nr:hypothetical protein Naga_100831g1 [Nannochloropsis gaditana]